MPDPVYTLSVELAVGSLTEVPSLTLRASWSRAVADIFSPLVADEALFELPNEVGSFSPLRQTALLPGRRVAFSATYSGSSYNLYSGRIKGIRTRPTLGERTTVIEAMTDIDRMDRKHIDTGVLVNINAASLFTEIMTRASVQSFSADSELTADTVGFAWYKDRNSRNAVDQLIQSGYYQAYVDGAGTVRLKSRYWGAFGTSVDTLSEVMDMNYGLEADSVVNRMHLQGVPRAQSTDLATIAYLSNPVVLPASGHVGFFVSFVDPRDFVTGVPVGSIVALVASQDFYAAANSDGTGADRTATLSLNMAVFGESAVCSLFNGAAQSYLTRFQVRGYPILAGAPLAVKIDDTSSQNVYGVRETNFPDNLLTTYSYLKDLADTVVGDRKEPRDNFDMTLVNEFPNNLRFEVGDILSVINSLTGVNSAWTIRNMRHEVDTSRGLEHKLDITLDRFAPRPWLVLDHPTYGKLDSGRQLAL